MSNVSTAVVAAPHATAPLHAVAGPDAGVSEENRWLLGFGLPCLVASLFVAAAIGAGKEWLMGCAILSLLVAIISVTSLAISSDTNANA
jgi:hypothetical protein